MHALAALLAADACSMLHAKHTYCASPCVTDARALLPMGRMRWQYIHISMPARRRMCLRCADAHMRTAN
eukprot:5885156-Pleurochrysis_carterae.AAC.2